MKSGIVIRRRTLPNRLELNSNKFSVGIGTHIGVLLEFHLIEIRTQNLETGKHMRKLDLNIRQMETSIGQKKQTLVQIESITSELLRMARLLKSQIQFQQSGIKNSDLENAAVIPPLLQSLIVRRKNIMSSIKTLNRLKRKTNNELDDSVKELKFLESRKQKLKSK